MKKYTLVLSVFLLAFILLGFNANLADAQVSTPVSGCLPGNMFSTTTGQPCGSTNTNIGCQPGFLFSPVTGKPCTGITPPTPVCRVVLNQELKIGSRGENVRAFQQTLKDEGFLLGKVDGIYGPITDGASVNYFRKCPKPIPNPNAPVISGVSGPQTLDVNQQGTWTVTAYSTTGGNLSYSVFWGDEVYMPLSTNSATSSKVQQSATFTHSYAKAGMYNPTFTVTSANTINCITTPCPGNGGSAQTSLSVNVGKVNNSSSILVISPNGGETWAKGTTQTIKWQDNTPYSCPPGLMCAAVMPVFKYDIKLVQYQSPCMDICPMYYPMPRTIATSVSGFSYNWTIPCAASNPCSSNFEIPAGLYTVQVCQSATSVCDSSNNYFQIISGTGTSSPSISSLSPASGIVDTQVTIHGSGFTATGNRIKFGDLGSENNPSYNLNSSDGRTLVFTVPSSNYMACWYSHPACYTPAYMTQPGVYGVSVINANGTSKPVNFTVTSSNTKGACEYPSPTPGYHYEGGQPYPTCGAYLVKDSDNQVY